MNMVDQIPEIYLNRIILTILQKFKTLKEYENEITHQIKSQDNN